MEWNSKAAFGKKRRTKNKDATQDMHHTQYFLHGKKTVGDHTEKKRRNDGTRGACHISEIDHIGHAMALHVISTRGIPGTPDEELQKHHDAEAGLWVSKHGLSEGLNDYAITACCTSCFMYCREMRVAWSTSSMPAS